VFNSEQASLFSLKPIFIFSSIFFWQTPETSSNAVRLAARQGSHALAQRQTSPQRRSCRAARGHPGKLY